MISGITNPGPDIDLECTLRTDFELDGKHLVSSSSTCKFEPYDKQIDITQRREVMLRLLDQNI